MRFKFRSVADRVPRPLPRTPKGAEPGHTVITKTTPSIVPEEVMGAIASAEDGKITKQGLLRLRGQIAIRARQNVTDVEIEIFEDMDASNKRLLEGIKKLTPDLLKQRKLTEELQIKYSEACASIPMLPKEDGSATWADDEPQSLSDIAAEHGLPGPKMVRDPKEQLWLMNYGSAASALMLSLGLHVIRGEEIDQIAQAPIPFLLVSALSFGVTRLLAASSAYIGSGAGEHVARASIESKRMRTAAMWIAFIGPLPLSFMIGVSVEAMVDGFGIYKSLTESSSTDTVVHPSPVVIGAISMIVAYPLFLYYSVKYFQVGYYQAFFDKIKELQGKLRREVKPDAWKALSLASAALKPNLKNLKELESEVEELEEAVRYELSDEEKNRLLDLNEKAFSADMELRKAMGFEETDRSSRSAFPWPARTNT